MSKTMTESEMMDDEARNGLLWKRMWEDAEYMLRLYPKVPKHTMQALMRYWVCGMRPGAFGEAVLKNDLAEAAINADSENAAALTEIALFVRGELPMESWGSEQAVLLWKGRRNEV